MDQELIAYLDQRFREAAQQIASLRDEMNGRFEQVNGRFEQSDGRFDRLERAIRETQITVEGLRSDVQQVAEGVIGVSERLESTRVEMAKGFDGIEERIAPFYTDLNRRVTFLEGWAERKDQDAIEVIRKTFGRPQVT
jgi:chromosome segregation ATPase